MRVTFWPIRGMSASMFCGMNTVSPLTTMRPVPSSNSSTVPLTCSSAVATAGPREFGAGGAWTIPPVHPSLSLAERRDHVAAIAGLVDQRDLLADLRHRHLTIGHHVKGPATDLDAAGVLVDIRHGSA